MLYLLILALLILAGILAGNSPNKRSYMVHIYTVLANPTSILTVHSVYSVLSAKILGIIPCIC
jgi:hypothetical protein